MITIKYSISKFRLLRGKSPNLIGQKSYICFAVKKQFLNMFKSCFSLACYLLLFLNINAQSDTFKKRLDSIRELRVLSKNHDLDIETRVRYAEKACELSYEVGKDTTILHSNERLQELYWRKKDFNSLKMLSYKSLKIAEKTNDSLSLARSHYYMGEFYRYRFTYDSAYYHYFKAKRFYQRKRKVYKIALVLYGLAVIQKNERDLIGSELTSIEAISLMESLYETDDVKRFKSFTYNNLGMVLGQLKQYEKSIEYYNFSLKLKRELKFVNKSSIYATYNNLGNIFKFSGQYDKAIKIYNKVLNDKDFINRNLITYAIVLDNYAETLYLSENHEQLPKLYLEALDLCHRTKNDYRSIIIHQHLATYYHDYNQMDSALYHGYKAKELSEQFYKDDLLKSILVLSKIEEESIAVKHYDAYIRLNDSIHREERLKRNKYARIQFETNQYIKETKRLNTQNILISVIGGISILVLGLLYFIRIQRSKNRDLAFEREQEKTNQEIYKLMLQQQVKEEEGRLLERHRIAEDLHDGVLTRLFGTRMGMGFLDLKGDKETLEKLESFINEMQDIEKDIRDVSHTLKTENLVSKTNFYSVINDYLENQGRIGNFEFEIKIEPGVDFEVIDDNVRVEIYRIIQESIQNIVKHARAKHVWVSFFWKETVLCMEIEDDGIGFDANKNYNGIGLKNLASRVAKIEGGFEISSTINEGTKLLIQIPINKESHVYEYFDSRRSPIN